MGSERNCPTPGKRSYRDKRLAEEQMRSLSRDTRDGRRGQLSVYHCACGRWHVGHQPNNRKGFK